MPEVPRAPDNDGPEGDVRWGGCTSDSLPQRTSKKLGAVEGAPAQTFSRVGRVEPDQYGVTRAGYNSLRTEGAALHTRKPGVPGVRAGPCCMCV